MIDVAPPAVMRAAASCEVFNDSCALRVYKVISAACLRRVTEAPACYTRNTLGTWDRKPWLREREPYVLRGSCVLLNHLALRPWDCAKAAQ